MLVLGIGLLRLRPLGPYRYLRNRQIERGCRDEEAEEHSVIVCGVCNVACNSPVSFKSHLAGQKHLASENRQKLVLYQETGSQSNTIL